MGLFDEISGLANSILGGAASGEKAGGQMAGGQMAGGQTAGGEEAGLMAALQADGLPGLGGIVQQLHQSGLGAQVGSWIGAGQNQPVSADDIAHSLSGPALAAIAGKLGVDPSTASALLSRVLPGLVDRQTPDGQDPATPDDSQTS